MKHLITFFSGLMALTVDSVSSAGPLTRPREAPTFESVATVSAEVDRGRLRVTLTAKSGWSLNTGYKGKLVVGGGSTTLEEARLLDAEPVVGKAHGAVWQLPVPLDRNGTAKFVFCDATSCTAPLVGGFTVAGSLQ